MKTKPHHHSIRGRPMRATLSTDNLVHNLAVIKRTAPKSKIIAMVKSNGYGHGLRSVAQRLQQDVAWLGVASINEALALRDAGITGPILLMEGVFSAPEYHMASEHGFGVVVHNFAQLNWLVSAKIRDLFVWLKVDTGMGRLGFSLTDWEEAYEQVASLVEGPNKMGLMSHFACASDRAHPLNAAQKQAFYNLLQKKDIQASLCNSAGVLHFQEAHYDYVRPGLALYGVSPSDEACAHDYDLRPVMTLRSGIIAIKTFQVGDSIGYGADYVCQRPSRIAVVACGYGDGYPQNAPTGTPVLVAGHRCPVVGRVSMDMLTIDITDYPDVEDDAPVVLWGEGLPLEEVALAVQRSPYELLTGVQHRVQFKWETC